MNVVVITPPDLVVTAEEARAARVFSAGDDDEFIELLLAAAQSQIEGTNGWLGRSIGEQELELTIDGYCWPSYQPIPLSLPPILEIMSIKFDDADGNEQIVDPGSYRLEGNAAVPVSNWSWTGLRRGGGPRVRYGAGWATGEVPATIKHAIMLMAAELRTIGQAGGIIRREQVEGIGSFDYAVPDIVAKQLTATAGRLLSGYKVWKV